MFDFVYVLVGTMSDMSDMTIIATLDEAVNLSRENVDRTIHVLVKPSQSGVFHYSGNYFKAGKFCTKE
jgi:F0F1-type ATP synthase beta subunit